MTDRVYIFDKITKAKILLGEIQDNFNMSFVIDGTKDSCKVNVYSFSLVNEVEPNTILWHENTRTWWEIVHDKVERHLNENGYEYTHELSLDGAIELLNARDLTDCGFNANRYSVSQFITRLFRLSNFEYSVDFTASSLLTIDMNKMVDYVKTYENYTLLSALRDFLGGYNCDAKLTFNFNSGNTAIESATLNIISKSGTNEAVENADNYFNQVGEIKTMDKNSFGTVVISNAENVIATDEKIYPLVGGVKLSSNQFVSNSANAVLRLPSKVFKMNWLKITTGIYIKLLVPNLNQGQNVGYVMWIEDAYDGLTLENVINQFETLIDTYCPEQKTELMALIENKREEILNFIQSAATVSIYDGNIVDPTYNNGSGRIVKGLNVPKLAYASNGFGDYIPLTLIEKGESGNIPNQLSGVVWERGSNIVTHFNFITGHSYIEGTYRDASGIKWFGSGVGINVVFGDPQDLGNNDGKIVWGKFSVRCKYIPMADLKIKIDNQRDKQDIQLYNQNGKLTDSNALSKLLNSYAKEISSDTITRYHNAYGTSLDNIKKVGQRFNINNIIYVVNNLSVDLCQNENGYFLECEYTLSKQFAVKSLMVNPNTNIRDYGIPQNFNVERKQVYRDYYEFDFTQDSYADNNPYCKQSELIVPSFRNFPQELCSYVGVIECEYKQAIGSSGNTSDTWYYQLDTTKYELDKTIYIALTFNDNNIIGYGSQNVYSGFDITRVFSNWFDTVSTPISYVDDDGEVKGISIAFVNSEQIAKIYDDYKADQGYSSDPKSLYNFSCFVPKYVYDEAEQEAKMQINETNYRKDALEVPVFEYACQIGDSENVLIGDKFLHQELNENYIYIYSYEERDPLSATPNNATPTILPVYEDNEVICENGCTFNWHGNNVNFYTGIYIEAHYTRSYNTYDNTWSAGAIKSLNANKDILLFRHLVNKTDGSVVSSDLMLIARNVPSTSINGNQLLLYINHWRLK